MQLSLLEKLKLGLHRQLYLELKDKTPLTEEEDFVFLISRQFFEKDYKLIDTEFKSRLFLKWDENLHQEYLLFLIRSGELLKAEAELVTNGSRYLESIEFTANFITELIYLSRKHFKTTERLLLIKPLIEQVLLLNFP